MYYNSKRVLKEIKLKIQSTLKGILSFYPKATRVDGSLFLPNQDVTW